MHFENLSFNLLKNCTKFSKKKNYNFGFYIFFKNLLASVHRFVVTKKYTNLIQCNITVILKSWYHTYIEIVTFSFSICVTNTINKTAIRILYKA